MNDNKTPHFANEYDNKIRKTIPQYNFFHDETIDLIKTVHPSPSRWLDTGCGTGKLTEKAIESFGNTSFILADPSEAMLNIAKEKKSKNEKLEIQYLCACTQDIDCIKESFDVITAIQSHHYLDFDTRKKATVNCFRLLKQDGIYVTFENIRPNTEKGTQIGLERWKRFQLRQGKSEEEVNKHIDRFGIEYYPISIDSHINILHDVGFSIVEALWVSNMQAGFYAIKA